jgi:hypothetical protein
MGASSLVMSHDIAAITAPAKPTIVAIVSSVW